MARGSFRVRYEFKSVAQIQRLMDGMALTDQTKVLTDALAEASRPIVEESRKLAPRRTGALAKSMGFIVRRYKQSTKLIAYIGARHMAFAGDIPAKKSTRLTPARGLRDGEERVVPSKYIHLVHDGFNHVSGKRVEGNPFLETAFNAHIQQSEWTLLAGCARALEAVWNRNVNKQNRALFRRSA